MLALLYQNGAGGARKNFPHVGRRLRQPEGMAASMHKQLARFLRQRRGHLSYPAFARKLGVSSSSLQRLEMGQQNVTLKTLEHLLQRLKCRAGDIFDR
jgi:DNA-binding Xre family transcriptional regulator